MKICFNIILIFLPIAWATAQTPSQPSAPAWSPAKSIGMFAYPKNGQNADLQMKDESECYGSAKQNSGVDPQAAAPAPPTTQQLQAEQQQAAQQAGKEVPKGGAVAGSARGAAGGAAIGAITGSAGTGAAIGATVGAMSGRRRQREAEAQAKQQASQKTAQAQQQAETQANAQQQAGIDSFKRAFSACMSARGYSVQ